MHVRGRRVVKGPWRRVGIQSGSDVGVTGRMTG